MSFFYVGWILGSCKNDALTLLDMGVEVLGFLREDGNGPEWRCRLSHETLLRLDPHWGKPFIWNLFFEQCQRVS